ncbi:MAG: hypothetical protein ATN35_08805 [Epulopiscium sp. Nele67-Bin004]|nr:MAG: hypothetical protein ATN35_08805 [Epulopiscium sp. Nele67-Bin004]
MIKGVLLTLIAFSLVGCSSGEVPLVVLEEKTTPTRETAQTVQQAEQQTEQASQQVDPEPVEEVVEVDPNEIALKLYYDMLSKEKILTLQESISLNYIGEGIINASVLDFDNDGISELFLLSTEGGSWDCNIRVYTTINNELKLAVGERVETSGLTGFTGLMKSQGNYYIYTEDSQSPEWFKTLYYLDSGEIKKYFLYLFNDQIRDPIFELNGKVISETEFRQYRDEIEQIQTDGEYLLSLNGRTGYVDLYTGGSDAQSIYNATQTLNQLQSKISTTTTQTNNAPAEIATTAVTFDLTEREILDLMKNAHYTSLALSAESLEWKTYSNVVSIGTQYWTLESVEATIKNILRQEHGYYNGSGDSPLNYLIYSEGKVTDISVQGDEVIITAYIPHEYETDNTEKAVLVYENGKWVVSNMTNIWHECWYLPNRDWGI